MDDAEYGALYDILNGDKTFNDWPKNQESSLRQRVYKKWKSRQYEMKEVHDPMAGNTVQRIVHTNTGSIVIKKSELSSIVHSYFDESKGDGALKLSKTIRHRYSGLSRNFIQKNLNVMKETQKIRPLFQNKAPLRPIKAGQVHERHQVDLVNMQSMPVTVGGVTYKYIMSVIDIFSRFVFLRPLKSKESAEVAENLRSIYNEHGPPEILQSDQGTEFKGVVKTLCEALNVRIIKSAAYSPQTQGKDERSHRTWKEKIKYDVINSDGELNWVENLPIYQQLYNESPHSSLGMQSPFEVYYGRQPNRVKNKLSLGERTAFEVSEEDETEFQLKSPRKDTLRKWEKERDIARDEAFRASAHASQKMIKRELKRNPPSLYYVGETVLVRVAKTKKTVKGKKTTLRGTCEGLILKADHDSHRYYVDFEDPNTAKKKVWVKVDDITSVTKEEEKRRQDTAKKQNNKRKCLSPDKCTSTPSNAKHVKLTNDVSLLDASIANVLSFEKLKGDTINLYFDFLRQRSLSKQESVSLASSYFYASLDRPENMSSYKNYVGKNPLQNYEHLIIPVHLPTEEHWLLAIISIISLCIYIYDSANFPENTYKSIFETLKQKFIKRERQTLSPQQCTLLHEDNWEEKTPSCPKQTNEIDCGVYTCSFAKQYLSGCNSPMAFEGSDFRNEMVGDLLELAASNKCSGDFRWLSGDAVSKQENAEEMSEKEKLDVEVQSAGLQYRDPPTPRDGNCMFHAISDQLARLGLALKTPSELRSNVVQYLRNNPLTSDGTHLREFISYQAWESYLRRMSQEGVWGDWITLWGLVNMLDIDVAVVSSIGEGGLRVISPGDTSNSDHNLNRTALLGHEAEEHYHSLDNVTTLSAKKGADPVDYMKNKYGEGKVLEEICPKCCKKFKCLSAGIYDDESGMMQYYADDCYLCDVCSKEEEWYSY